MFNGCTFEVDASLSGDLVHGIYFFPSNADDLKFINTTISADGTFNSRSGTSNGKARGVSYDITKTPTSWVTFDSVSITVKGKYFDVMEAIGVWLAFKSINSDTLSELFSGSVSGTKDSIGVFMTRSDGTVILKSVSISSNGSLKSTASAFGVFWKDFVTNTHKTTYSNVAVQSGGDVIAPVANGIQLYPYPSSGSEWTSVSVQSHGNVGILFDGEFHNCSLCGLDLLQEFSGC